MELNANTAVEREQRLLAGYVERRGINKENVRSRVKSIGLYLPKREALSPFNY